MEVFFTVLSITLVQIPAIILRYIPFSRLMTQKQRKSLFYCYSIGFSLQNILLLIILTKTNITINPFLYKMLILFGATIYFCMNCVIIKRMFYQHIFIYGMQGSYSLFLHSFVAIVLSLYAQNIAPNRQLMIQSFTYLLLFTLTAYPLWQLVKNSFILNISAEHDYYWNTIWLIPVLLCSSNTIVTIGGNWINTWQQLLARLLIGIALFVIWKCVNLDFKELEEKLALKSTNKLLHIQMEAISHQAEAIKEKDEKISILRHDMRHNVQILSSLIANGELTAASLVLTQLNEDLESTKPIVFCKNPVINSSLLVYISKAQEEKIEIISEVDIPQNIPWSSSDIAILFANVLENAINASRQQPEGKKEIRITTRYADKKLAISVENRFDGNVLFGNAGMPLSIEEDHGIGMSSVSTIVSRYHGHVVCSHVKGWFTISFMFSEHFIDMA
jgi:signal transduction histidine kinase